MAYLKRVTPIYGAYKTITLSVLAFILITGCVLLYLNPGDHQLMMDLLLFLIVGPAVISPLMELVEFGAELRNLSVRMDQIDDVLKMEPIGEGLIDAVLACPALSFRDVSFSYQKAADPLRRMALDHVSMEIPVGSFVALVGPSGGGKSTVGQLLARFWDVESGSIAIDGTDIRDYGLNILYGELFKGGIYLAADSRKGSLHPHCGADGCHASFCEPGCQRIGENGTCKPG